MSAPVIANDVANRSDQRVCARLGWHGRTFPAGMLLRIAIPPSMRVHHAERCRRVLSSPLPLLECRSRVPSECSTRDWEGVFRRWQTIGGVATRCSLQYLKCVVRKGRIRLDTLSKEFFEQLEASLRKYVDGGVLHMDLAVAWKACGLLAGAGRLRAALVDLQLNVVSLDAELRAIGDRINPRSSGSGAWSSSAAFSNRMQLFSEATSYVMRYRAIWDKLMGIVVLLAEPKSYDSFCNTRSRKAKFHSILVAKGGKWKQYAEEVRANVSIFDDLFRTAEAHGTGLIRKLVFLPQDAQQEAFQNLFWAYNSLNSQLLRLKTVFDGMNASNKPITG